MTKISTKEQYEWALARVEELLPQVDDQTAEDNPARIELELLSNLVADYSDEHFSIGEPSLSDVLKLRMYELGMSQKDLAETLEISPSRISDYFSGRAEPTLSVARRMCKRLDIEASIILGV